MALGLCAIDISVLMNVLLVMCYYVSLNIEMKQNKLVCFVNVSMDIEITYTITQKKAL